MSEETPTDPVWKLLLDELRRAEVVVHFTKRDGTKREMRCTLKESAIPQTPKAEGGRTRKSSPDVQIVWDLDAGDWRSFRRESIDHYVLLPFPKEETHV